MVGVMAVLMMLAFAGVVGAAYLTALHRARSSADLAALSGAVEVQRGGNACEVAGRTAEENWTRLISCELVGDQIDFVVTVRVACGVHGPGGLPAAVEAVAYAGSVSGS
jgi:secretion/DNA translocation related TadE-like protein